MASWCSGDFPLTRRCSTRSRDASPIGSSCTRTPPVDGPDGHVRLGRLRAPLHSELAFLPRPFRPDILFLHGVTQARVGGATTVYDGQAVARELDPATRRTLAASRLRYRIPVPRQVLSQVPEIESPRDLEREQLGWTTHLRRISSLEKLTAGGMSFLDSDVIPLLEEVLPARFGGGPADYRLVEDEGEGGEPRLRLLVNPRVGDVDLDAVAEAFLAGMSFGSGVERVMGLMWRQARLLRVERRSPLVAASGKILHLHVPDGDRSGPVRRRGSPADAGGSWRGGPTAGVTTSS